MTRFARNWWRAQLACGLLLFAPASWGFGWPSAVEQIQRALASEQPEVRRQAAGRLTRLPPSLAHGVVLLALKDSDEEVRLAGARAAVVLGREDVSDVVLPWLKEANPELRLASLNVLCQAPRLPQLEAMARAALDPHAGVRRLAVKCLGRSQWQDRTVTEAALASALDDADVDVRSQALESVGRLSLVNLALPVAGRLQDPEAAVRRRAAVALGVMVRPESVVPLTLALGDSATSVAVASARSLGMLRSASAVAALQSVLQRPTWDELSGAAAEALGRIGVETALAELVAEMGRQEAIDDLTRALIVAGQKAAPVLAGCLREGQGARLMGCARVSSRLGLPLDPLLARLSAGELSAATILSVVERATSPEFIILALERLELGETAERAHVLSLLERSRPLPDFVAEPLAETLSWPGWSSAQRARLLFLLAEVPAGAGLDAARPFLQSSQPALRAAAARVVASQSDDPKEVLALLRASDVTRGAAQAVLAESTQTTLTAALLEALRQSGGVSSSPLTVALGRTRQLDKASVETLGALLQQAEGPSRDVLLEVLSRQSSARPLLAKLLASGSVLDRRTMAALLAFESRGERGLLDGLLTDPDRWVRTFAAQGLENREKLLALVRDDQQPSGVRTAALLRLIALGGASLGSGDVSCPTDPSAPLGLRLVAVLQPSVAPAGCPWRSEDLLRRARDPLLRLFAARTLRAQDPSSPALRACATYESDPGVAAECQPREPLCPEGGEGEPMPGVWLRAADGSPRVGVPYARMALDGTVTLGVTDRRGKTFGRPPLEPSVLLDPRLAF